MSAPTCPRCLHRVSKHGLETASGYPVTTFTTWPVVCRHCGRQRFEHDKTTGQCPTPTLTQRDDQVQPNECPTCGGTCPDPWHRWAPAGDV